MLAVEHLSLGYRNRPVLKDIHLTFPDTGMIALLGGNGCGKTTLLHALAGLLKPDHGNILLDNEPLRHYSRKAIARKLALLPQVTSAPAGVTVRELVMQGRFPWQNWWRQWSQQDQFAVDQAIQMTAIEDLADRPLEQLSGGQRQRCWVAMTLAQDTPLLLLDEPATYLDIAHQVELMNLVSSLCASGKQIIAVLHDLNQAAAYADHMIMMKDGGIFTQGPVESVFTRENLKSVFNLDARIIRDEHNGHLICVPDIQRHAVAGCPQS
ncbi:ABC transporter ATP-binding protein [Gynuella sunshinyii]|uniref:ABC-type cobalamin/Fe3+-siderophores transport system, ATPase component n=1 Tax=Gynuella sunshinyii YC6258 TaxID=1445510 RepID=A0A0C5V833_9GAMM|nr:ABC transporter ATP-binding protein [Gynuella sunshinyii]AJQ95570.1 ABC-type cobalamin/Fe3+-siderophores transport system, ATPase component [Gynuella sunshinyii YC6258]